MRRPSPRLNGGDPGLQIDEQPVFGTSKYGKALGLPRYETLSDKAAISSTTRAEPLA